MHVTVLPAIHWVVFQNEIGCFIVSTMNWINSDSSGQFVSDVQQTRSSAVSIYRTNSN